MAAVEGTTPADLLSRPLHAITEVFGVDGLRERFRLEVERLDEADRPRLHRALARAAELHRDDVRVREPYLNHLLRVTIRIMCYYRVRDSDVLVAALLHDSVEDHAAELARGVASDPAGDEPAGVDADEVTEAAFAVLRREFGGRVADLVRSVTNPRYTPDRDRDEQYREHVAAALDRDPYARLIKLSDFTDNGTGIIHSSGPKLEHWAAKYLPLVPVLRDLARRPDTPLDDEARAHVLGQLDLAERRLAAIVHG